MTALQVNGSAAAASTLAAAGKLYAATGGTSGNTSTKVGSGTLFKQIFAKGTTTNQTGVSSIPTPTDSNFSGWLWDVTTLEGQTIAAGTWTPTFHLLASTGTTITPTVQWYKRSSAGAYTSIGSVAGSSIALTTSSQALTFTPPSLSSVDFATGDKLVMWLWVNQTAGGATNSTISVVEATSGSTAGVASQVEAVTPGYAPTPGVLIATCAGVGTLGGTLSIPILVLYGSSVADTTLTTACQMANASGGVETSKQTAYGGGSGNFGEVWSKGNAGAVAVAAIPAPTGNGWVYYPGAGTFLAGNWSLVITYAVFANNGNNQTFRIYQLSGGVYTSIGTILFPDTTAAKTTYSPAAVSMPSVTTAAGDGIYFDLWYQSSFGAVGDNATVYESTSAAAGVTSDLQVTTAVFNPSSGVVLSATCAGVGTLAGTFTLATSLSITIPGTGTLAPTLSASLALPAVTLSGVGTLTATPALGAALTATIPGIGTLTGTLTATGGGVSLAGTCAGVGTLTGTMAVSTSLAATIPGVGTLAGTFTEATALTVTIPGVGTLSGTMATKVALAATIPGVGTLSGTLSLTTALSTTIAGVGTLNGTLSTGNSAALSVTCAGAGTLAGTLTARTALSTTLTGSGTLSGTLAYAVLLSVPMSGTGTLSGVASVRVALSVICASMGTLAGLVSLFNTLAQPGIALVLDSLYHQAALRDSLVQQAAASDMLRGQAAAGDVLLNQATASDVSPGSVTLSDQG